MSTTGRAPALDRKVDRVLLARVHWCHGDSDRALAALRAIAADEPERAAAAELRADICRSLGQREDWERDGHHVHPPAGRPFRPAPYALFPRFLDDPTCRRLRALAVAHRHDFTTSLVGDGVLNPERRRGLRLRHPQAEHAVRQQFLALLEPELPRLLDLLAVGAGPVSEVSCTVTASTHDGFFSIHRDDRKPDAPETSLDDRVLSFVCWFHREPPRFTGGELALHDTADWRYSPILCTLFRPEAGTLVVFPSTSFHAVRAVGGDVTDLADARLAVTGHIRAPRTVGGRP